MWNFERPTPPTIWFHGYRFQDRPSQIYLFDKRAFNIDNFTIRYCFHLRRRTDQSMRFSTNPKRRAFFSSKWIPAPHAIWQNQPGLIRGMRAKFQGQKSLTLFRMMVLISFWLAFLVIYKQSRDDSNDIFEWVHPSLSCEWLSRNGVLNTSVKQSRLLFLFFCLTKRAFRHCIPSHPTVTANLR